MDNFHILGNLYFNKFYDEISIYKVCACYENGDTRKAYLRNELRYDDKQHFSKVIPDYQLTKIDVKNIKEHIKKHKKKEVANWR